MSKNDDKKLAALIEKIRGMGEGGFRAKLLESLAQEALTQVSLGFRGSVDPYGNPWRPPKFRAGKPLLDTGRLRSSFAREIISDRAFRIGSNVKYARIHQTGGVITPKTAKVLRFPVPGGFAFAKKVTIPSRLMVPTGGRGLGRWAPALAATAQRHVKRYFGKR